MKQFSTWVYVARVYRRWPWLGRRLQALCGKVTGHEKGDLGWDGNLYIHAYCRWCNHWYQLPLPEGVEPTQEAVEEYMKGYTTGDRA